MIYPALSTCSQHRGPRAPVLGAVCGKGRTVGAPFGREADRQTGRFAFKCLHGECLSVCGRTTRPRGKAVLSRS